MAIAAFEQLLAWRVERVAATLARVTADIAERAAELGLGEAATTPRGPHMLGLRVPADARQRILTALTQANCFAALRGEALPVSPHLHITTRDVDCLIGTLARGPCEAGTVGEELSPTSHGQCDTMTAGTIRLTREIVFIAALPRRYRG
jgi:hypothetical protein